ncbi:MAG: glycosyltransferase [Planctomycetota bacterium]|jgi:UDP:flavonoid glycosyltransferase YjiC (YdhE family)
MGKQHMRVLFVAIGSSGDVHPLIGLGLALRQRGHDVTILASTHFESQVQSVGLEYIGIGTEEEYQAITGDPALFHPIKGTKRVLEHLCVGTAREIFQIIDDTNHPGESIVISSGLVIGARIAQEKLGVPLVTTVLQPMMFRSVYQTARYDWLPLPQWTPRPIKWLGLRAADVYVDSLIAPATNEFRRELGLPPVKRFLDKWWASPQLVMGLFPDWFGPIQPDWPVNTVLTGFPMYDESDVAELPQAALDFLAAGDPPIVFTPGTAMHFGHDFFEEAAKACQILGRRGILLSRFRDHIPENLPRDVVHFDYLALSSLLPRCAAMVYHGGMGTMGQVLKAGIPHLVMPMAIDQPDNADRLVRLGVADRIKPRAFRGPAVARKLDGLLNSTAIATTCKNTAGKLEHVDGRANACAVIEDFAATVLS